jgi:hypothetical protein
MDILLVDISAYLWLLVVILLVDIGGYFINGHWWLFRYKPLVIILL